MAEHEDITSRALNDIPEYRVWCHIKGRCYNPNDDAFVDYGGRGMNGGTRSRSSMQT